MKKLALAKKYAPILLLAAGIFVVAVIARPDANTGEFERAFAVYDSTSGVHEEKAAIPGIETNPIRRELAATLAAVLTSELDRGERLRLAGRGLELIEELEAQIDEIGEAAAPVHRAILDLEEASEKIDNPDASDRAEDIIRLSEEESEVIADIRGLSYKANTHTARIFERVRADGGALTDEHVLLLNWEIPKAEADFNRRSALHDRLVSLDRKIERKFNDFKQSF